MRARSVRAVVVLLAQLPALLVDAAISFALPYNSHMVLQSAPKQANVWGWSSSDAEVTVTLSDSKSRSKHPAALTSYNESTWTWHVLLPATPASDTPFMLTVSTDQDTVSIHDVLWGDVWLCSGQSNMAFLLENAFNGSKLVQDSNNHPMLRMMTTQKTTAATPLRDLIGPLPLPWSVSNNISVSDDGKYLRVGDDNWLYMSAVCYLFGLNIHKARGVPVGLINTNWGGTVIQDWSSAEAMAKCANEPSAAKPVALPAYLSNQPTGEAPVPVGVATHLFNAMVSPLLNSTIFGAIWYQGESNGGAPVAYGCQQPALVADWRSKWHVASNGQTDPLFPFGIVQLAPVINDADPVSVAIRWFQTGSPPAPRGAPPQAIGHLPNDLMPNTFLATTIDLGDATSPYGSVHCRYKTEVGERLALKALKQAYEDTAVYAGPVFSRAETMATGSIELHFNDTGAKGLQLRPMVLNKNHSQGNWTGKTPFEVCIPPGGSQPGPELKCLGAGALLKGGDLLVTNMTISAAEKWCTANTSCSGFTTEQTSCSTDGTVSKIFFKAQIQGRNNDASWTSFEKSTPCTVLSRYDYWEEAPQTSLGAGGRSIVLSGMKGEVAAVRMNWRSYPCEHLSCGLYSAVESLPPSPFWVGIEK